jgi:hypothetical protein
VYFLTEDLLSSIKLRTMAPISQTTFQDSDLILLLNEELQLKLVSDIQSIREDYFLTTQTQNITANISGYYFPERAIGNSLRAVSFVDAQGNESAPLNRITIDRAYLYSGQNSVPVTYYIQADQVVVLPKPSLTQGTLKLAFAQRPNQIVSTTSCAKITSVSSLAGTTTFTVNTDLTSSLSTSSYVDFLRIKSPFMLWAQDVAVTAITSSTIQVSTTSVSDANSVVLPGVGDYICPAKQANIPQIPQEFHPMLAQMVALRLMEALGDMNKYQAAERTLTILRKEAVKLIKNRVESSPEKVDTRGGLLGRIGSRYGLR